MESERKATLSDSAQVGNANGSIDASVDNKSGSGGMVKLFLDRGADVHLQCEGGSYPLHYAVMAGNKAACKLLLKAGARINATDYEGTTVNDSTFLLFTCKVTEYMGYI